MLSYEIKHAVFSKKMIISIVFSFVFLIVGGAELLFGYSDNIDFSYMFLHGYSCGTSSLLALIFPVFACLPYANNYAVERESGYWLYKRTKVRKAKYIAVKMLVSALSGGIALSIPVACYLLLCILIRGTTLINNGMEYVSHRVEFYQSQPVLYCMGYIGNAFVCGVIFALLGLAVSVFVKNRYVVIFLPLVLYIIFNMASTNVFLSGNPVLWWDSNLYQESNEYVVAATEFGVFVLVCLIFSCGVVRNEKE